MKRHTLPEVIGGWLCCIVMMVAGCMDVIGNARKGATGWAVLSLLSALFFAAILGWTAIDAFNRHQRRRRQKVRESSDSIG